MASHLQPGAMLKHYRLLGLLGRGGMGEVHRARDTNLNRDVAVKILPEAFAADAERLARFKREAQILASLNHPNIATIHGFEHAGESGVHTLVMELVDGQTLADRLAGGPIPYSDALAIARQIAAALEAAHEQGIVHRDLKPANVKVRDDGTVKVLDFGLAKALDAAHETNGSADSPTITSPAMTEHGIILGTAAYMSPEQARGRPVDKRTDIWAFGCVLYEMLSGRRAFDASNEGSISDTLAAILRGEPDWTALPHHTPPAVRVALRRCLEKDRRRRIADIADVMLLIDEMSGLSEAHGVATASAPTATGPAASRARWLVPVATAVAAAAVTGAVVWQWRPAPAPPAVQRLVVTLPDDQQFAATGRTVVAISPDGARIAYVANQQLYLRPLDQLVATSVPGTSGATSPFFSPDSQQIGFWQNGQLKRMAVAGGSLQVICAAANPYGVSWSDDGTIVFGQGPDGIFRVRADGGTPEAIASAEARRGDILYAPELLPGGRTLLFTVDAATQPSGTLPGDNANVVAKDLDSGKETVVVRGTQGRYLPSGHIVFARQQTLWAMPFDPRAGGSGTSSPVSMVEGILQVGGFGVVKAGGQAGTAQFAVSANGVLVYVESDAAVQARTLVWVDRQGIETPVAVPARAYGYPRIAPNGTQVAFDIRDEGQDIWVLDLNPLNLRKLTFESVPEIGPAWTPDSRRLAYFRSGRGLFWQLADGAGSPELLVESATDVLAPSGFTADGEHVLVQRSSGAGWTVRVLNVRNGAVRDLIEQSNITSMNSALSPDSRFVAYQAVDREDSARWGIYIRPFPEVQAGRWQVACEYCTRPVWSRDGRELFFLEDRASPDERASIWSVPIQTSPVFRAGTPRKLFEGRYFAQLLGRSYDVSPDGRRFLMVTTSSPSTTARPRIVVVNNWTEDLKRRVPVRP